jgi:phosphoribosyl 1,2-cyclic phosphodiesterase
MTFKGFCPLASGSKGNCIYLGTEHANILIDAGISGKAAKEKLNQIGVSLEDIDAILVTHEHVDHIQGLKTLALRHQIPVFANAKTAEGIVEYLHGDCPKFKIFTTGDTFEFADLVIHPFNIQHDTMDPVAFTIQTCGFKLGFCADLGFVTNLVQYNLKDCDYVYLEANHDIDMVHRSSRPAVYKQRVLGRNGHLSNVDSGALLRNIAHDKLKKVYLAHLSSECNTHETAVATIRSILEKEGINLDITVAPQDSISVATVF